MLSKTVMLGFIVLQVKKVKPHVLLGLSGVGGIFHEEVGHALFLL